MNRAALEKLFVTDAVVVIEHVASSKLVIGSVRKRDRRVVTLQPLGTQRRTRVALDRIRRAQLLGEVDGAIVGTILRHHAAGIAVRASDINFVWEHE